MIAGAALLVAPAVTVVSLAGLHVSNVADHAQHVAVLRSDLNLIREAFADAQERAEADLNILANTPPIQGLARTAGSTEPDPLDGTSTAEDWRKRLNEIFVSFLKMRPDYVQIRLIANDARGSELVRVDRSGDEIMIVPQGQLQAKNGEFYFAAGAALPEGESWTSPTTLNRENGEISEPRTAVARVLYPVFAGDGSRFGFLVINYDAKLRFETILRRLAPRGIVVGRRSDGRGFSFDPETGQMHAMRLDGPPADPAIAKVLDTALTDMRLDVGQDRVAVAADFSLQATSATSTRLGLIVDHDILPAHADSLGGWFLRVGIGVLLLSLAAAACLVHLCLRPLLAMTSEITEARRNRRKLDLPAARRDEIGALARSFGGLVADLASREARLDYLFDGVRDGICIMDASGRITMANAALKELLGYSDTELVGQDAGMLMPEALRLDHATLVRDFLRTGDAKRVGQTVVQAARRKDGSDVEIELSVSQITKNGETYFAALIRDVSEKMETERERDETLKALEASNEELDRFAYAVSHDLKSPLRAVTTATDWLSKDLAGTLDEDSAETLAMMNSRVRRMGRLLDGLLEHARIGRQKGETHSPVVTGAELAQEIVDLTDTPDTFSIRFTDGFVGLRVRQLPVQTVLLNLVSNAVKHHDRRDGRVDLDARVEDGRIRFCVRDDGPGIPPEYHERVFELFQTMRSKDRVEGSGIGLSLCRKYVALHGGELVLRSGGAATGTEFEFTWPLPEEETANVA